MKDQTWVALRAALMIGFAYLAGKGLIPADQVPTFVDQIINLAPLIISVGSGLWAIYIRWNTRAVPAPTAARIDVPTVSPVTGATIPGPKGS